MGSPAKGLNESSVLIKKLLYTPSDRVVYCYAVSQSRQRSRGCQRGCGPEHPGSPSRYYRAVGIERLRAAAELTDELGRSCGH